MPDKNDQLTVPEMEDVVSYLLDEPEGHPATSGSFPLDWRSYYNADPLS